MSTNDESQNDSEFEALMDAARELPQDMQPERDLWPGIKAAIDEGAGETRRPGASRWSINATTMLAQAAAVVLLVGGSSALTWLAVKDDGSTVAAVPASNPPLNASLASFGDRYSLGPGFQDARRDLEARLAEELELLSPETRRNVEENLATIRGAIEEINQALAAEPDNPLLQELLLASYREELAVMRKVNGISSAVMLREDI